MVYRTQIVTRCLYIIPYLIVRTLNSVLELRHSLDARISFHIWLFQNSLCFHAAVEKIQDVPEVANERESCTVI